jgi:hypothetical protein
MIVETLNVRGVRGTPEFLSLKSFLALVKPNVLLIQETMVSEAKAIELFGKLLPNWYVYGVDSSRLLGRLLTAWNPRKVEFSSLLSPTGILLDGLVKYINKRLKFINCYGPYFDREEFLEVIRMDGLIKEHNIILRGNLNFTTSNIEVWGSHAKDDPLQLYFIHSIQVEGLVDVEPIKLLPT